MNKDKWSRQFYKALEAIGKLTEQEKIELTKTLQALCLTSNTDNKSERSVDGYSCPEGDIPNFIPPPPKPPKTTGLGRGV